MALRENAHNSVWKLIQNYCGIGPLLYLGSHHFEILDRHVSTPCKGKFGRFKLWSLHIVAKTINIVRSRLLFQ